jgi:uncharacterized protein YPO0396
MRKSFVLLCFLLLLVSLPIYSAEVAEYETMTNTAIVETFIAVFDELDQAYLAYTSLYSAVQTLAPQLQEISQTLQTGADTIASIQADMQAIENAQQNYEQAVKKQIRDITIQAYLIGATAILSAILLVILT